MAAIFTDHNGKQFHYVRRSVTVIVDRTVINFGVKDARGREVGASRAVIRADYTILDTVPRWGGPIRPLDALLVEFEGLAYTTRNGSPWNSGLIHTYADTPEAALAELDRRIEQSRKRAVRKYGKA